jgi:hypothetical protein
MLEIMIRIGCIVVAHSFQFFPSWTEMQAGSHSRQPGKDRELNVTAALLKETILPRME